MRPVLSPQSDPLVSEASARKDEDKGSRGLSDELCYMGNDDDVNSQRNVSNGSGSTGSTTIAEEVRQRQQAGKYSTYDDALAYV